MKTPEEDSMAINKYGSNDKEICGTEPSFVVADSICATVVLLPFNVYLWERCVGEDTTSRRHP
jgi:hypothetical protein